MWAPLPTVLYLEDSPGDVLLLARALRVQNVDCNLQTVSNVPDAKSYLTGKSPYGDRAQFPMPALIVTDLTMPGWGQSSLELVSWIRSTAETAELPIICATGNEHPGTLERFAKLNIICYRKTSDMLSIANAIKSGLQESRAG